MTKAEAKKVKQKAFNLFSSLILAALLVVGTLFVALYAYGYRFSLDQTSFEKTGVLSVDSNPSYADILLNGENKGKTSKTIGSIKEGTYAVQVQKENYQTWQKALPIKAELSTSTLAFLFLSNAVKSDQYALENKLVELKVSKNSDHYFMLTYNSQKSTLNLLDYRFNKNFWEFGTNPLNIFTLTITADDKTNFYPSENGDYVYLTHTAAKTNLTTSYVIKTSSPSEKLDELNLRPFANYTITWAKDNRHLVMESSTEILSMDIANKAVVLLLRKDTSTKNTNVIWQTDSAGNFYYIEDVLTPIEYQRIKQKQLDGTSEKIVLDEIYWQKDNTFLKEAPLLGEPFTNSPQSTMFSGRITAFSPNSEQKGIVIETEYALYWFDTKLQKYYIVIPEPGEFIDYSPDNRKFTYTETEKKLLNVYTLS